MKYPTLTYVVDAHGSAAKEINDLEIDYVLTLSALFPQVIDLLGRGDRI
jgi:hypothetical protein